MQQFPRWVDILIKVIRPISLLMFVLILVIGSIWFSLISFFYPVEGKASMETFIGFFAAMDSNFYTTIQVMFTSYVLGRSGQAIAKDYMHAKLGTDSAETSRSPSREDLG